MDCIFKPISLLLSLLLTLAVAVGPVCAFRANSQSTAASPQASENVIRDVVASGKLDDLRWPSFPDYKSYLTSFYASDGYRPAWIQGAQPASQALTMIGVFKEAWKRGLEPEDYDASRWENRLLAIRSSGKDSARFDVALTVCTMRFVSDLRIGRVNPKHFKFSLSVEQKKYDLAQFVRERLLSASDLAAVLDSVEPPFAGYRRTQAALVRYAEFAGQDDYEELPASPKPIDPGQPYAGVPRLARFLLLVGDLSSSTTLLADSHTYDEALVEAVKRFQRRHGLKDDGRLGTDTLRQLNVPLSDRVRQLQLALERWRWLGE